MSAPTVQTDAERAAKFTPLRVENGRVAAGPYKGATVSQTSRWDCVDDWAPHRGLPCFKQDGWWVHNPSCQRSYERPPEPLPLPGPYEARQIEYQELVRSGHLDPWDGCYDGELARRQANTERGAW